MDQRANRMKTLIINTFFDCLETLDFTQITIGKISDQAMINRSTFYRYFSDKYILRDTIVADIVKDFADHMEVDFLHMDIKNKDHTMLAASWIGCTDPTSLFTYITDTRIVSSQSASFSASRLILPKRSTGRNVTRNPSSSR